MKIDDYWRAIQRIEPDEDLEERLKKKVMSRNVSEKTYRIWAAAVLAACALAAAIVIPAVLNGRQADDLGSSVAVGTPDASAAVSAEEIKIIYGGGDYSAIYTAAAALAPAVKSEAGEDSVGTQSLEDLQKELAERYSNPQGVTAADERGYTYSAANRTVSVLDMNGETVTSTECGSDRSFIITSEGETEIGVYEYYNELLLRAGKLYALKSVVRVIRAEGGDIPMDDGGIPTISQHYTLVEVYDVSVPDALKLVKEIAVSGAYIGTAFTDSSMDVISRFSQYEIPVDESRPETYVPMCYTDHTMRVFSAEDIRKPENNEGFPYYEGEFLVGVSIGTAANEPRSFIAVEGAGSGTVGVYFGSSGIYALYTGYTYEYDAALDARFNYTEILKITDTDGSMELAAQGRVRGTCFEDSRGIAKYTVSDEGGRFAVATRVWMSGVGKGEDDLGSLSHYDDDGKAYPNYYAYYVLDDDLNIVSTLDRIGYVSGLSLDFVAAYRENGILYIVGELYYTGPDPDKELFMIDVRDPDNPVLLDNSMADDADATAEWVCAMANPAP